MDIYMPDFKYADRSAGEKYSGVGDYPSVATAALAEMYRQVGPLHLRGSGVADRGVLVRHLVLPGDLAASEEVIRIVAAVAPDTTINVMGQYHPCHRAGEFSELMGYPSVTRIASLRGLAASVHLHCTD